jgi:hypothetical protein
VEGSCEHGHELSGSKKYLEFLELLLLKDSAPWSYFSVFIFMGHAPCAVRFVMSVFQFNSLQM